MPRVTVRLYGAFRDFAEGRKRAEIDAGTVGEALDRIVEICPSLRERVRDERGRIREHTGVFANAEEVSRLDGQQTTLREGDTVHIIPAISGGRT